MTPVEIEEVSVIKSQEVDTVENKSGKECEEVKSGSDSGNGHGNE